MAELRFVNHKGESVSLERLAAQAPKKKAKKEAPASFHNGWRVQGIPPGGLQEAKRLHKLNMLQKPFDEQRWLMNAKRKPVRSKPYELESAARECMALAQRAGWLQVEIVELKKGDANAAKRLQLA